MFFCLLWLWCVVCEERFGDDSGVGLRRETPRSVPIKKAQHMRMERVTWWRAYSNWSELRVYCRYVIFQIDISSNPSSVYRSRGSRTTRHTSFWRTWLEARNWLECRRSSAECGRKIHRISIAHRELFSDGGVYLTCSIGRYRTHARLIYLGWQVHVYSL